MRRRQADAFRPAQGADRCRLSRQGPSRGSLPRAVRGSHAGPPGPHPLHLRQALRAAGWTGPISITCCWSAVRRACRWSARCCRSSAASRPTVPWRPTRRWPTARPCRPADPGQAPTAERRISASATSIRTVWAWWASTRRPSAAATALSFPATRRCRSAPSGRSRRPRTISARSWCRSWKARAHRLTIARPSAAARWPASPGPAGQVAGRCNLQISDRRPLEGPRERAKDGSASGHGDRPRERPEQGAHGRLAAIYLGAGRDGVQVIDIQAMLADPELRNISRRCFRFFGAA